MTSSGFKHLRSGFNSLSPIRNAKKYELFSNNTVLGNATANAITLSDLLVAATIGFQRTLHNGVNNLPVAWMNAGEEVVIAK